MMTDILFQDPLYTNFADYVHTHFPDIESWKEFADHRAAILEQEFGAKVFRDEFRRLTLRLPSPECATLFVLRFS